jgi:hypothetical protein
MGTSKRKLKKEFKKEDSRFWRDYRLAYNQVMDLYNEMKRSKASEKWYLERRRILND